MTLSLVIACSQQYEHHLDGYWKSVQALNTQPDEVIVVTDNALPMFDCMIVRTGSEWNLAEWYNMGFNAASGEWIAWTGVDDRFRPHAFDDLKSITADVHVLGLQYTTGQVWIPTRVTAEEILNVNSNLVTCGSPVRRYLWEKIPFQPSLYPFDDWGFWVGCAFQGATFSTTKRIDVDYEHGPDHLNPPLEPTRTKVREWLESLRG